MKRTKSAARGKGDDRQHRDTEGATLDEPTNARKSQDAAPVAAAPPADPKEKHLRVPQQAPPADPREQHLKVSQAAPPADPREPNLRVPRPLRRGTGT